MSKLRAPLILTARHPAEGGQGSLHPDVRRGLLEQFLEHAAFIDIEVRSLKQMRPLLLKARQHGVAFIFSWHDFDGTLSRSALLRKAKVAASEGATIFKIVTRTDTRAELARLISVFQDTSRIIPVAAMGIGKFGPVSRIKLTRLGSALTYVSVGKPMIEGQPALSQLRRHRNAYVI